MLSSRYTGAAVKRVMVVDDHAMVRKGLVSLIQNMEGWEVCAEACDGNEAVAIATEVRPDVILMDVSMPGLSGMDATVQIRKALPQTEVLILTMHESDRITSQARRAGARGCLSKTDRDDDLKNALNSVARHRSYFAEAANDGLADPDPLGEVVRFTPRERQIVTLVAEGQSNKAIARSLSLSPKTVETHRAAAMHKIGARSAAELTLYAARNHLVVL